MTPLSRRPPQRVVLLLDLDCFYSQTECIRLGLDASAAPLALFQWNSVLAVTYPARNKYGVGRGDPWDVVAKKSAGQCLCVHVPVVATGDSSGGVEAAGVSSPSQERGGPASLEEDYDRIFCRSDEDREKVREAELGVRRYSSQGKACIERYRTASARIFQTVCQHLERRAGYSLQGDDPTVILERASIDEFYLDVSAACWREVGEESSNKEEARAAMAEVLEATVVVGDKSKGGGGGENEDDESTSSAPEDAGTVAALQVGCRIAYGIRKAIKEELGFTLSAGVSINKTLAKLAASYGKPNGQAVCYPDNVVTMLNETQIGKCRHLGGKRGSKIQALLPAGAPTTVGSIAENLSLKDLERAFSDKKTAVWLWDLAHGIDHEAVSNSTLEHAAAAPPKSITAFKSLPQGHTLDAAQPWLKLLATEIVTRVERDTARHARTPHTCSVSYACHRSRTNTSLRIDFPPVNWNAKQKIQHLIDKATAAIRAKEGKGCQLTRIGLSAGGFRPRDDVGTQRIDHFFSAAAAAAQDKTKTADSTSKPTQHAAGVDDQPPSPEGNVSTKRTAEDKDFELAQKLQERYNTENRLLQQFDEKKKRLMAQRPAKTRRIDSFFTKR